MRYITCHWHAIVAAFGLGVGASIATAQIAFTDVTDASGAGHFSESYGASWGDLDGDGYPDLFTSNHRTKPSLFLNMGNGKFVDVGAQTLDWQNRQHADTHGASWADYNNDGAQDLMVSTGTGNLSQFLVNQNQRLVDLTVPLGLGLTNLGGRLPVWLDYDKDHRLDVVVSQYGGVAKLFHQLPDGTFTEASTSVKLLCKRFHYAQLLDVNNDGQLDFVCPDEALFPQKIYDPSKAPWKKLFDSATPAPFFPLVSNVADSAIADFNNDGRMDVFVLGGVQLRPSSVVQGGPNNFEALLAGGSKGAKFVSSGVMTFKMDWNKAAEGGGTDITKILIGAGGKHPTSTTFVLDPLDPTVAGLPPAPTDATVLPILEIGYNTSTQQWTMTVVTKLDATGAPIFSQGYFEVSSTAPITGLTATGLWPGDLPGRPTLLMNNPGGFVDGTVAAGLDAPVQCASVTAGDFDNDMWVDLYLACRTGASNIPNILYHNNGNGTFTAVPDAGGAAGPVGLAIADGAGTADSVVSADYDVDGFLDLYVTNGFNLRPLYIGGPNKLFHNNGNANHWIEIDLVGTNSDRDATGARVYATANGVTQLRVQNGAYHRWSQDLKRSHFGLAGATAVDLKVMWPSGAVENYPNVAADQLYRITEGSGIAPVALGIAPAYPCGPPPLNGATDSGVFIWRDCPSGQWRLKTASAGGTLTYSGTVTSSAAYVSVAGVALTASDSLDYTTNPNQIVFSLKNVGKSTDGVNFVPQDGASSCLSISAPGLAQVHLGPFRVLVNQPFDLDTQSTCH
jgi:FG-GAP-like repeat/ASPIC and UnbV